MTTEVSKYIPKVKERFPYLKDDEIEAILNFGFRTIFALVKLNADVFLKNSSWSVHFGKRHLTKDDIHKYMCWKTRVKSRLVDKYAGKPFDGVYYFGLSEEDFQKFRKSRKHKYTFTNIYLHNVTQSSEIMQDFIHMMLWVMIQMRRLSVVALRR